MKLAGVNLQRLAVAAEHFARGEQAPRLLCRGQYVTREELSENLHEIRHERDGDEVRELAEADQRRGHQREGSVPRRVLPRRVF